MSEGLELEFSESNKRIGIVIAIMAAVLAFVEAAGSNAASDAIRLTVEASDTWAFYQAKTIRMTTLKTEAEALELTTSDLPAGPKHDAITKAIADWRQTADRYESDPEKGEGRKELSEKAKKITAERDDAAATNATFDLSSGALQLGILLASAAVVTSLMWLAYLGGGLGLLGAVLGIMALWAPHVLGG